MLERWKQASLRERLVVQFSLALGAILIVFLYISTQAVNSTMQDAPQQRSVLAKLIAQDMDTQLHHAVDMLSNAATSDQLNFQDQDLEPEKELLKSAYEHSVFLKRIYPLDPSETTLWMAPFDEQMLGVNLTQPPYSRDLRGGRRSDIFLDR